MSKYRGLTNFIMPNFIFNSPVASEKFFFFDIFHLKNCFELGTGSESEDYSILSIRQVPDIIYYMKARRPEYRMEYHNK